MNNIRLANRIKNLAKENGIILKTMLEECNLSHNFFYDITKNNQVPAVDKIERIADYLNCSVDYLLGRTDIPSKIDDNIDIAEIKTHIEKEQATKIEEEQTIKLVNTLIQTVSKNLKITPDELLESLKNKEVEK